jgi:hypothetical protein
MPILSFPGAMISHIHFNNNTNMLAGFHERKVIVWSLPSIVFSDKDLLPSTMIDLETEDMGKSAFIIGQVHPVYSFKETSFPGSSGMALL